MHWQDNKLVFAMHFTNNSTFAMQDKSVFAMANTEAVSASQSQSSPTYQVNEHGRCLGVS
jgi:hypothetical protein